MICSCPKLSHECVQVSFAFLPQDLINTRSLETQQKMAAGSWAETPLNCSTLHASVRRVPSAGGFKYMAMGHGSKPRTPSQHPNPHKNGPKWLVHLPQNAIPLVLTTTAIFKENKPRQLYVCACLARCRRFRFRLGRKCLAGPCPRLARATPLQ